MITKLFGPYKPPKKEPKHDPPYGPYSMLFSSPQEIQTPRLLLRQLVSEDIEGVFEMDSDQESCRQSLAVVLESPSDAKKQIDKLRSWGDQGFPAPLAVVVLETNQFIGTCGVTHVNKETDTLRLGFSYIRSAWNHGYGTEALRALTDFLMECTEVHRIECHCFPENKASRRIMEKNDMSYEGVLREAEVSTHGRHDCCVYSILRPEWAANPTRSSKPIPQT